MVVLIDEYDKPILDNITRPEVAREMRDGLRNVYSVIKDADAHIRFAFLTGVSKFSKVSLFSGLNNLRDITVSPAYSTLCGYTEADVDTVFAPELCRPGTNRKPGDAPSGVVHPVNALAASTISACVYPAGRPWSSTPRV